MIIPPENYFDECVCATYQDAPNLKDFSESIPAFEFQRENVNSGLQSLQNGSSLLNVWFNDIKITQGFLYEVTQSAVVPINKRVLRTLVEKIKLNERDLLVEYAPAKLVKNAGSVC